jgi:hypothetical protein
LPKISKDIRSANCSFQNPSKLYEKELSSIKSKDLKQCQKNLESYNSIIYSDKRKGPTNNPTFKLYKQAHNSFSPKKQYGGMHSDFRGKINNSILPNPVASN